MMSQTTASPAPAAAPGLTRELAEWIAGFTGATASARLWARHALLDWAGVTIAGSREPLAGMLADEFGTETGPCTLVATGRRAGLQACPMIGRQVQR
jgi:hypothetical protein